MTAVVLDVEPQEAVEVVDQAPLRPSDRVCGRALSLAVLGAGVEEAATELLELAHGNPHVIGQARDRCVRLVRANPDSPHADRALALATHAWLSAIAAA